MGKCAFWQLDGDCAPHSLAVSFSDTFRKQLIAENAENDFLAPQYL
jgi:hypothetical protein